MDTTAPGIMRGWQRAIRTVLLQSACVAACTAAMTMQVLAIPIPFAQQMPSTVVPHRTRLILKDHSYQLVMSYRIQGDRVLFVSAEREGEDEEEIPVALVDFDATHRWEQAHALVEGGDPAQARSSRPAIDPELLKEEEERRALTPEVAPNLLLPERESVMALDVFQGTSELVPLAQSADIVNDTASHEIRPLAINPMASPHPILHLRGEQAAVQLHVNQPVLYIRLKDDAEISTGGMALTVDTHGASSVHGNERGGTAESRYVVVRANVRQDERVVASFDPSRLREGDAEEDVVETTTEVLPGNHWMKVMPKAPLLVGEYALVEVISPREVNLGVWDFGVSPMSPENEDARKPIAKPPIVLERREPE